MVSVVISSRQPQYLQQTVNDLLEKAEGSIEVIVVFDGIWMTPMLKDDPRVVVIHHGEVHDNYGMRASLNAGIAIAQGEYVLQTDEHCMFDQGWDVKLLADMEDDWLVIPRRKRLDADNWSLVEDGRSDIDYMHIDYPYQRPYDKTCGLHGAEWKQRGKDRAEILIDETPTMQGSCYFFKRSHWDKLFPDGLDDINYGTFTQEAQEIGQTYWFTGGKVMVNKKTWYAHFHKGKSGKGCGFTNEQYKGHMASMERGRLYCINHWLYTKDYKYDWDWFMQKFPDMPGWGEDWKERIEKDKDKDYSTTGYKDDKWLEALRK